MQTKTVGLGLIGVGLVILLFNFYDIQVDLTLLFIGGCFLAAYFGNLGSSKKNIGFLIPGCILFSLGIYEIASVFAQVVQYEDVGFFVTIGTAFLAIFLIGKRDGIQLFWAFIVSMIIYGVGVFVYLVSYSRFFTQNEDLIFPFIMIIVGVSILVATTFGKIRKR